MAFSLVRQPAPKTKLTILPALCNLAFTFPRLVRTRAHIQLPRLDSRHATPTGTDIKVENVHGETNGGARVGDVDNACDVALDGRAREQEVDLVVGVAKVAEVFNNA